MGKKKKHELLSTKDQDNQELWKEKEEEFHKLTTAPTTKRFKDLHGKTENKTLKEVCGEAYKSKVEEDIAEATKYCSMAEIKG